MTPLNQGAPRSGSNTLRCAQYFVHAPVKEFLEGTWIGERSGTRTGQNAAPTNADYIFGSYERLTATKTIILRLAEGVGGPPGSAGDWHVHHVVEGDIYADIHFEDVSYDEMYRRILPCVLVHKGEHNPYFHGVSRSGASQELYGVKKKGQGSPAQRAQEAHDEFISARIAGDTDRLNALRKRVSERETMFADLHHYNAALSAVTEAVFRRVRTRLQEPA